VRWSQKIRSDTDVDGLARGKREDGKNAFGLDSVTRKCFAHECCANSLIDMGRSAAVVGDRVTGLEETTQCRGGRAESRDASATARYIPMTIAPAYDTIPDTASIARVETPLVGMLKL